MLSFLLATCTIIQDRSDQVDNKKTNGTRRAARDNSNRYDMWWSDQVMHMYTFNTKPINPTALLPAHIRTYSSSAYAATGQGCMCNARQGEWEKDATGVKHLVFPCSTFTHGRSWLGSFGLTNESGHSARSMSTTLFWAKQGTSTLIPVGNVYVDDVRGNRSCASIFIGQESDTIAFGLLSDTKGSCENIHARAASAPSEIESPPCTSHSRNR